jgi:hypothetical protein
MALVDDEKQNPMELRLAERRRYLTALQKYDQRLWDPVDMMRKQVDLTYGIKPEKDKQFDLPPHIILSAHISTAMQGSIVPGTLDPTIRSGKVVLENTTGRALGQEPFNSVSGPIPPGIGDANTDQLLQKALKQYLQKGEMQTREALTFNDRMWRGQ